MTYLFHDLISLISKIIPYLMIPSLYGLYYGMNGLRMWKNRKIKVCIVSTLLVLLVSTVISMINSHFPSLLAAVLGGILSYYACDLVHKAVRNR